MRRDQEDGGEPKEEVVDHRLNEVGNHFVDGERHDAHDHSAHLQDDQEEDQQRQQQSIVLDADRREVRQDEEEEGHHRHLAHWTIEAEQSSSIFE